jgi:probable rRNA maturation factor
MILLDPDLDPDPSLHAKLPRRSTGPAQSAQLRNERIPNTRMLALFLREAQAAVKLRGQVTVLLTTDAAIRRLNRQFRGKNKATDVLSFPADAPGPLKIAGDVAISIPMASRQASERGHSLGIEIKVLMLHGLLHLAGYDHEADSGEMARREHKLRAILRLPRGLIERTMSPSTKLGDGSTSRVGGIAQRAPGAKRSSTTKGRRP